MKLTKSNFSRLLNTTKSSLFENGWLFFVPYFSLYILFLVFHGRIQFLKIEFLILHVLTLALFISYLSQIWKKIPGLDRIFWSVLFFVFLIPGAYLEVPSDPWGHFEYISQWHSCDFISDHMHSTFSYFWNWTLIGDLPVRFQKLGLDLISAFWQWLLAFQVFCFVRTLGFKKEWAFVQVFGFIVLFGTNLFSYRYYALGPTVLAYIAYLRAISIFISWLQTKQTKQTQQKGNNASLCLLPLLVLLIALNHFQELIFLGISALTVLFYFYHQRLFYLKYMPITISILVLFFIPAFDPWFFLVLVKKVLFALPGGTSLHFVPFSEVTPYLNYLGMFKIYRHPLYMETYGIPGILGLVSAVVLMRKNRLLSFLSLAPSCFLLFPPFAVLFGSFAGFYTSYRVLYAMPLCFALTALILFYTEFIFRNKFRRFKNIEVFVSFVLIALLSLPYRYPWRGRGWFQFYKPPAELSLNHLSSLGEWMKANNTPSECPLLTDHITAVYLRGSLGYYIHALPGPRRQFIQPTPSRDNRRDPLSYLHQVTHFQDLQTFLSENKVCKVLAVNVPASVPLFPSLRDSKTGASSKHWVPEYFRVGVQLPKKSLEILSKLEINGWKKQLVPPFYSLWTKPL